MTNYCKRSLPHPISHTLNSPSCSLHTCHKSTLRRFRVLKVGRIYFSIWLLALAGCVYQPQTLPETPIPEVMTQTLQQENFPLVDAPALEWWRQFNAPQLDGLLQELNHNNLDLTTARTRIERAKALQGVTVRSNRPSFGARTQARGSHNFDSDTTTHNDGLSLNAAYEVDLWGVQKASQIQAQLNVQLAKLAWQNDALELQTLLVMQYLEWLASQARLEIAQQNLAASLDLMRLIELRFHAGSASGLELDQQRNTYLNTRAQMLALERQIQSQGRALAFLLGRDALTLSASTVAFKDIVVPSLSFTQPAALLENRPDIQLAEAELRLQDITVFQTQQKRWPSLNLNADLSLSGVDDFKNGWTGSILGSLSAPLFNADGITQQIQAAQADYSIAQTNYRQTVLQAMLDALESLSEWRYQKDLFNLRQQELSNNEHLYQLARIRFDEGDTDFLNLLTAQRSWFAARDSMVQAQLNVLLTSANVFRTLGVAPAIE